MGRTNLRLTRSLRLFRRYHKYVGLALASFLLVSALTGLLLGWKKDVGWIQPPTQRSERPGLDQWMDLEYLAETARAALRQAKPGLGDYGVDRLDIRPDKGIVKVLFVRGWWEVQLDGRSGEVLSVARRNSDWIEALHDGSIVSDGFKLVSMNLLGLGLLLMVLTGLWLWYGPRKIRGRRRGSRSA